MQARFREVKKKIEMTDTIIQGEGDSTMKWHQVNRVKEAMNKALYGTEEEMKKRP